MRITSRELRRQKGKMNKEISKIVKFPRYFSKCFSLVNQKYVKNLRTFGKFYQEYYGQTDFRQKITDFRKNLRPPNLQKKL